jgi:hypothetical protein
VSDPTDDPTSRIHNDVFGELDDFLAHSEPQLQIAQSADRRGDVTFGEGKGREGGGEGLCRQNRQPLTGRWLP